MKVAVIILQYKGEAETLDCLTSLEKVDRSGIEIMSIVVDNASPEDATTKIFQKFPQTILIKNTENLGFAGGNNVGINYAIQNGAEFILVLNNDTILSPNIFTELVAAAKEYPRAGIFCPKIYFARGFETHKSRYAQKDLGRVLWYAGGIIDWANMLASHRGVDEVDHGQYDVPGKTMYATGCALFVRTSVIKNIGSFDPQLYLYYEDLDLCERAKRKGYEVYYIPKAFLWHKNASSTGGTGSDLHTYYITRNRLLIGFRYAPWRTKFALFREAMRLTMSGTITQRQAVGDFIRKQLGKRK